MTGPKHPKRKTGPQGLYVYLASLPTLYVYISFGEFDEKGAQRTEIPSQANLVRQYGMLGEATSYKRAEDGQVKQSANEAKDGVPSS